MRIEGSMIKTTTIRIDKNLHKEAMKHCIDLDISFNEYVNRFIKNDIDNYKKEIDERDSKELDIAVENFLR